MNKEDLFNKEYEYIKSDKYKKCAKELVGILPDYFFKVPASSTGKYHPTFSLGDGGLLRHTKAAMKIAHELLENESIGYEFTSDEKDLMIISLMVHDGLKLGFPEERYTRFDHPIIICDYIESNKDKLSLSEEDLKFMRKVISSHMGQWNTNQYSDVVLPLPKDKYQRFVHLCDYLASRKFLDIKFSDNDIIE